MPGLDTPGATSDGVGRVDDREIDLGQGGDSVEEARGTGSAPGRLP